MTLLEVRAGRAGLRVILGNLRKRWWVLALIPVPSVFASLVSGNGWKGLIPGGLLLGLVLLVLAVILACLAFYARSTITVTTTELIVKRVRRRVLARSDVGEALVALFGARPQLPSMVAQAFGMVITDREGNRFVRLPLAYWPDENGVDAVLEELRLTPRFATAAEEKLATPFVARRPFVSGLIGATVLIALIVGVVVLVDRHRADDLAARAVEIERGWPAYADQHLTSTQFPHLIATAASAFANDDLFVSVDLDLAGGGPELRADESMALIDSACGYGEGQERVEQRVELRLSATTPDLRTGEVDRWRTVQVDCDVDRALMTSWLRWAERHPLPVNRGPISVEQVGDADHPGPLDVRLDLPRHGDSAVRAGIAHLCEFRPLGIEPGAVSLSLASYDAHASYAVRDVVCTDVDAALTEWKSTVERH